MTAHNAYSSLWFRLFMPMQTEESTRKQVAFLARQLPLPRYRRVLDLCCGYGRHALGLAGAGYHVTGLDRDDAAIAEAERRAREAGLDVTCRVGDMREVGALPGEFDAVINMWQSLSYFDEETNAEVLRQIRRNLAPGGRFIVDLYNREYFERNQGQKRQEIDGMVVDTNGYLQGNRWHSVLTYHDARGVLGGATTWSGRSSRPTSLSAMRPRAGLPHGWSAPGRTRAPRRPRTLRACRSFWSATNRRTIMCRHAVRGCVPGVHGPNCHV